MRKCVVAVCPALTIAVCFAGGVRTVEDALKTRPAASYAAMADAAAKKLTGQWISNGVIPGKVVFEETAWNDEAFSRLHRLHYSIRCFRKMQAFSF